MYVWHTFADSQQSFSKWHDVPSELLDVSQYVIAYRFCDRLQVEANDAGDHGDGLVFSMPSHYRDTVTQQVTALFYI